MHKIQKNIQIVHSTLPGLSSVGKKLSRTICELLREHYNNVSVTTVDNLSDLTSLVKSKPDLVFLGMKFLPVDFVRGRRDPAKIWLSSYLDTHGIAYTGSQQPAIKLELNKQMAKQRVLDAGLRTSHFFTASQGQYSPKDKLPLAFPLFVKPTNMGGGQGIDENSVVYNFAGLEAKIRTIATAFQSDSLVEAYLSGREFSVAILEDEYSNELLAMPIELVAEADIHGNRILGSGVKSSNTEAVLAVTDSLVRTEVIQLANDVFCALGARDYGRIDIRFDSQGEANFLEANLIPSLTSGYGSFPKACSINKAIEFEEMILRIVRLGLARNTTHDLVSSEEYTNISLRNLLANPV